MARSIEPEWPSLPQLVRPQSLSRSHPRSARSCASTPIGPHSGPSAFLSDRVSSLDIAPEPSRTPRQSDRGPACPADSPGRPGLRVLPSPVCESVKIARGRKLCSPPGAHPSNSSLAANLTVSELLAMLSRHGICTRVQVRRRLLRSVKTHVRGAGHSTEPDPASSVSFVCCVSVSWVNCHEDAQYTYIHGAGAANSD